MTQPEVPEEVTEAGLSAFILAMFTAWLAAVGPAVLGVPGLPDLSAIFRFERLWITQVDSLMPWLARLARRGWVDAADDIGSRQAFDPRDPELVEILAETRNLWVRLPERVYQDAIKSLADGRDRGETTAQLEQRIRNILTITGSENWPNRAQVAARTEFTRFDAAGALALGRRIEQLDGLRMQPTIMKRWLDRDDDKVRRTHARVDNRLHQLGEPFQVGTSRMQAPGDPAGSANNVVNCRCRLQLVRSIRG